MELAIETLGPLLAPTELEDPLNYGPVRYELQ